MPTKDNMSSPQQSTPPWPAIDWLGTNTRIELVVADRWYGAMKPTFDLVTAFLLLIVALPIIAVSWVIVRLTSAGPGFYVQTRAGREGQPYSIIKLRSMAHNCEARSGIQWSQKGDLRITRIGKILRLTHLDELPQLINVLRGEMSLVGPRPERPEVIRAKGLGDQVPGYRHRLWVKPGVTGLAQVQLPADSDLASVRHKVVYDLYYIVHQSLWLDLRIIAATVFKAAGMGPESLRRIFFLPTRDQVAEAFLQSVAPKQEHAGSSAQLQPV